MCCPPLGLASRTRVVDIWKRPIAEQLFNGNFVLHMFGDNEQNPRTRGAAKASDSDCLPIHHWFTQKPRPSKSSRSPKFFHGVSRNAGSGVKVGVGLGISAASGHRGHIQGAVYNLDVEIVQLVETREALSYLRAKLEPRISPGHQDLGKADLFSHLSTPWRN